MANDRENQFEGQDESEYHFSDDQMNYEMDETSQREVRPATTAESVSAKVGNNRRLIVGGTVFFGLIYIVYKMLMPAPIQPTGEITQVVPTKPTMAQPPVQPAMPAAPVVAVAPTPVASVQAPVQSPAQAQVSPQAQQPTVAAAPVQQPMSQPAVQTPVVQTTQPAQAPPVATITSPSPSVPTSMAMPTLAQPVTVDANVIMQKLLSMEQQNAKLSYSLETEYTQKLANYEQENSVLQGKVQALNNRIANLETSMNQLNQTMQPAGKSYQSSPPPAMPAVMNKREPRITYTVQAIIPGRAWLKSESGDTVTIAEGDVLKSLGKVTKIDPYDGVVQIDTGVRIVSLTYGGGGE